MAISIVPLSGLGGTLSARTSISVSRPDTVRAGDVMLLFAMLRSTSVTPAMPGWSLVPNGRVVNSTSGRAHQLVCFFRVDDGTGSVWTMGWGGASISCDFAGGAYRGCAVSAIDDAQSVASAGLVTTVPYVAATFSGPGMAVWCAGSYQAGYPSQPAQWWWGLDSGDGYAVGYEVDVSSAGVSPTPSPRSNASDALSSITVALRDAGGVDTAFGAPLGVNGVNSPANGGWPGGYAATVALGASHVRVDFGPGMPVAASDAEFADAAAAGLSVLPVVSQYAQLSTIDKNAFAAYVASIAARYGPGGTFWQSRTDGHLAPGYIEVANEPWGSWFYTVVEPAEYADVFRRSVIAGRAANPAVKYLIAGVDRYFQAGWQPWVPALFAAQPDLASFIGGVTIHLYGVTPLNLPDWSNYQQWPQFLSVAEDLWARGARVRVWVTEFGLTTCTNTAAPDYGVSQAQQSTQLQAALAVMHGRWRELLGGAFVYRYRDGVPDARESRWGIVNNDGSPKPAYTALTAALPSYTDGLLRAWAAARGWPRLPDGRIALTLLEPPAVTDAGIVKSVRGRVAATTAAGVAADVVGFRRDADQALCVAIGATGSWQRGFLRDGAGALCVATVGPFTEQLGFLRDSAGRLAVALG